MDESKDYNSKEVVLDTTKPQTGSKMNPSASTGFLTVLSSESDDVEKDGGIEIDTENKPDTDDGGEVEVTSGNSVTRIARKYGPAMIFFIAFIFGLVLCCVEVGGSVEISQTLGIAIWIAGLWLTELVPLVVTSFMPLFLFPMFGILSSSQIASAYINNTIFLFIAGMIMALGLERWDLHRRFSYKILSWCGTKPGKIQILCFALVIFCTRISRT